MHLMMDFETKATDPMAVVLSLGCVLFDEQGITDTFYRKFKTKEQEEAGRTVNPETMEWWSRQSEEARKILESSPEDTDPYLIYFELYEWLESHGVDFNELRVWANGASFDPPILESFIAGFEPFLYKFWNIWCFRTFDKMTGCRKLAEREGTHHNALDDAIYQTNCLLAYWKQQKVG